jgi:internalin A
MDQALALIAEAKRTRATYLNLSNCDLSELPKTLIKLTWLKELNLSNNRDLSELSTIKNLVQLQILNISNTKVSDLSPVKDLTQLQILYVSNTQVSDLAPIKNLAQLQILYVYNTQVSDLAPIKNLAQLQMFSVSDTQIGDLAPIKGLAQLKALNVFNTKVRDLSPVKDLTQLQKLDVSNTKVSDLSPVKDLTQLQILYVSNTQVSDLAPIKNLAQLQMFSVSDTQVGDLAPIKDLAQLQELYAYNTQVSDLSPIKDLAQLQILNVHNTQVSDLSPVKDLTQLQILDVRNTRVSDLRPLKSIIQKRIPVKWGTFDSRGGILVKNCPLTNPPIEIVQQGNEAILRYLEEQERSGTFTLNEARLLVVGQAGAGKTSLRTKIMDDQADLPAEDKTTRGIDIETYQFPTEAGPFDLRIWDFGGQNIQHYAHQFFLSDSVVYALVRDERREDGGLNYWLNIISLLGKDSPVIIVQNQREGHGDDIKELAAIRKAFPNVQDPVKINLKRAGEADYRPFRDLKEAICSHAKRLPHVGRSYAASYKLLQDDLQAAGQNNHFIRLEDYEDICQQRGMTNRETMYDFLRSYHQLGVSLWFEHDLDLENYVFLKPKWIIDALFELLYDNNQRREQAIIDTQSVKNIWRGEEYRGMHGILLKLMRNFEMCYEMSGGERYLIPQNQPPCDIEIRESATATRVLFEYEFLPKGFLTRLICRQHHRILEPNVWNNAVIFGEKDGATVLAYETYDQNIIELIAEGTDKTQLLNETISQLDAIHKDSKFKNLQVKKWVPCTCRVCKTKDKPHYFDYDYLRGKIQRGAKQVECQKSFDDMLIKDILKEIQVFSANLVKTYLAEDKIDEALKLLRGELDNDHEIIAMMAQLKRDQYDYLSETITREEYTISKNKKVKLILALLEGR